MSRNTAQCAPHSVHRTANRREQRVTKRFAPLSVRPGRLNMFPAYSVKTHMIISTSILFTTAHRAIFQCGARGVRSAVFRDALLHMYIVSMFAWIFFLMLVVCVSWHCVNWCD